MINELHLPKISKNLLLVEIDQMLEKRLQSIIPTIGTTAPDRYECGVQVACQELGIRPQSVYQNIENIPHRKLHGKLYFNRVELQEYIKNGGKTASQLKAELKK